MKKQKAKKKLEKVNSKTVGTFKMLIWDIFNEKNLKNIGCIISFINNLVDY